MIMIGVVEATKLHSFCHRSCPLGLELLVRTYVRTYVLKPEDGNRLSAIICLDPRTEDRTNSLAKRGSYQSRLRKKRVWICTQGTSQSTRMLMIGTKAKVIITIQHTDTYSQVDDHQSQLHQMTNWLTPDAFVCTEEEKCDNSHSIPDQSITLWVTLC